MTDLLTSMGYLKYKIGSYMKRYFEKIKIASKMRNAVKVGYFAQNLNNVIFLILSTEKQPQSK